MPLLPLLSPALSVIFLLLLPCRLYKLSQEVAKVRRGGWLGRVKIASSVLFSFLQVVTLLFPGFPRGNNPGFAAVSPVASFGLVWLSQLEHQRSARPSGLIQLYLISSLLCDLIQLTVPTIWLPGNFGHFSLGLMFAAKLILLCVESLDKQSVLLDRWRDLPPEERAGILSRAFVYWISPVLARGYKGALANHELPDIDRKLSSKDLRAAILQAWVQRSSSSLPLVLAKSLLQPFLAVIVPRLCLLMFRYGQPLLIRYAIVFVNSADTAEYEGYFIVLAAIFIYAGLAISTRAYKHGLNRLEVMIRGSLIGLLHERSLVALTDAYGHGKTAALVTTDVSALEDTAEMFHETWAQILEVIIGTALLAKQVGWVWPLPHVITIGELVPPITCHLDRYQYTSYTACSQTSRYVAKNLKTRQTEWNAATRKRLSITTTVLGSIKTIKMLGMQDAVKEHVLGLRNKELDRARAVRWVMVIYNASANALGMFAPVVTVVIFALIAMFNGMALDTETAFPTIAILALVTNSANMVMTYIPRAVSSYASFERIQSYLEPVSFVDHTTGKTRCRDVTTPMVLIKDLDMTWKDSDKKILENINMEVSRGAVIACSGPVGAGKTILARAILGELVPTSGIVRVSTDRVAYCAQTPWLPNLTIKEIICGPTAEPGMDEPWYNTVVRACCLDQDLAALPNDSNTVVGDEGMNLSGGQRQRVALARAIFQRCDLAIFDDTFSALDGRTDAQVAQNLFGPDGLFRKAGTTVLWITNSTEHFHLADSVIILERRIAEQGHWSQLKAKGQQIAKLIRHDNISSLVDSTKGARNHNRAPAKGSPPDTDRGNGDISLYGYYFASAGFANIVLMIACTASYSFFITFPQYWVKWWTQDDGKDTVFYASGYALLNFMAWVTTNGIMWSQVMRVAPTSGLVLHERLLRSIMRAPLFFFSNNDTGVLLNHFSQDIQLVDKQLASSVSNLAVQVFKLTTQASLLFAVQPIMIVTLPFCTVIVYVVQRVYLRTSRQLRLIELESRSAVYSSLLETARGIETIRAFGWQSNVVAENVDRLDLSQRPFYLLLCLQRWLNIVLDFLIAAVAVGTITLCVVLKGTTTGGQVGVALSMVLAANTTLLRLVGSWTNLEISLGAVSRLKTVEETTLVEDDLSENIIPGGNWPTAGGLEFKNVSASYNNDAYALHNLDLKIDPGQTVVICGRTGSGKSSLLLTLLRLLEIRSGSVLVDDVDISRVPRAIIRQRCFITIAQDPFLLPDASLRFNLDPEGTLSDLDLVDLLERVGLLTTLLETQHNEEDGEEISHSDVDSQTPLLHEQRRRRRTDTSNILDRTLSTLPVLSGGQAQLLALARGVAQSWALSRANRGIGSGNSRARPIVLLDEVTSSLDAITETTVYDIVQEEFVARGHTVIMVTHRLGAFLAWRAEHGEGKKAVIVWMKEGCVEKAEHS
ncbi:P-loop containing nucleoside triphosphate hydrolase protein [Bombardia bombarda]|uniref:P-loop containing nucleoside triphosphate hydrolase protein n=1 Tax=Bombardia bombarda TaxID=252184 RepID=A0AA39WMF2_9PEZI|nr:P-loop containing nucleoside triphosphate hydrolase protein [Bombardia bombarda]